MLQPITRRQILDSSKLKKFADDNFKFDENGRKLSNWVENTVGKGEIARCEQFLLFLQCFQKACFPGASKGVNVWEWLKLLLFSSVENNWLYNLVIILIRVYPFPNKPWFLRVSISSLSKTLGKGEIA